MKILLIGAQGRLGSAIARIAPSDISLILIGSKHSSLPSDIAPFLPSVDLVLDVSMPNTLMENLPKIKAFNKPLVIGSTGHTAEAKALVVEASKTIPILLCSNFSPGIACIKNLLPLLPDCEISITETHHTGKRDSPSGTALDLASHLKGRAAITSIRKDPALGEHVITLALPFETIQITHTALSRDLFAHGAIKACKFLVHQPPGLYNSFHE